MNITVTYRTLDGDYHLQIDPRQELSTGLRILHEAGKINCSDIPDFFLSAALCRQVSAYCTFKELGIYSGDILSYE